MSRKRFRVGVKTKSVELNITAFMNLMVVLVPFLLMMTVFANISVLDFKLPSAEDSGAATNNKKPFGINVIIYEDRLMIADQNGGVIKNIPILKSGHNFQLLTQTLRLVKSKYPDLTAIAILSEPKTFYDNVIKAMDAVREYKVLYEGEIVVAELFPDISIGDAPRHDSKGAGN